MFTAAGKWISMAQRNMIHQALTCIYTNLQENKFLVLPVWKIQISMSYFWNSANHTVKLFFLQTHSLWLEILWEPGGGWSEEGRVPSPRTVPSRGGAARISAASRHRGRKAGWSSTGVPLGHEYATTEPHWDPSEVKLILLTRRE